MVRLYFAQEEARALSRTFYATLLSATQQADADEAERLTRSVMGESIALWRLSAQDSVAEATKNTQ